MTFKDKHALETLPKTIAALQEELRKLQNKLDDPQFYARDRSGFEKVPRGARGAASNASPRRKSNGWSLKSCARNWPAAERRDLFRIGIVIARSDGDEAIQLFSAALDCFAIRSQ